MPQYLINIQYLSNWPTHLLLQSIILFTYNNAFKQTQEPICLQYSCHGVVWLSGWLAFCWMVDMPSMYQMQMNMFLGLILDIVFVAVIKAATRRRRPTVNDDLFSIGPDKFRFVVWLIVELWVLYDYKWFLQLSIWPCFSGVLYTVLLHCVGSDVVLFLATIVCLGSQCSPVQIASI